MIAKLNKRKANHRINKIKLKKVKQTSRSKKPLNNCPVKSTRRIPNKKAIFLIYPLINRVNRINLFVQFQDKA